VNLCRACTEPNPTLLLDLGPQPIAHRPLPAPDVAEDLFPFALHQCSRCGLVQILYPIDAEMLYGSYNFCFTSWKPEPHLSAEVAMLDNMPRDARVLEIGCNEGTFLAALREAGFTDLHGLEPNPETSRLAQGRGFDVMQCWFDRKTGQELLASKGPFDLVVCREVLEHLEDLNGFFDAVHGLLRPEGTLFLDLPDFEQALECGDTSLIWEEHVNYFAQSNLATLMARHGFQAETWERFNYAGTTLAVRARRTKLETMPFEPRGLCKKGETFITKVRTASLILQDTLRAHRAAGFRTVIYGAGCRATVAINAMGLASLLDCAVDDQPSRQGMYMAGSRLPIYAPDTLKTEARPTLVLLACNQDNEMAVTQRLVADFPTKLRFLSFFSPGDVPEMVRTQLAALEAP